MTSAMDDDGPDLALYYAIVGSDGSNIGMARILGAIGVVLVLAFFLIEIAFG